MPVYDFVCDKHDPPFQLLDRFLESWRSPNPPCPTCETTMERIWTCALSHDPGRFQAFDTMADLGDGKGTQKVTVDSLHKLRRVEKLTHDAWKAGFPGAQPLVWRLLSQDASLGGQFRNVFSDPERPRPRTRDRRGKPFVTHKDIVIEADSIEEMEQQLRSYGVETGGEPLFSAPDHLFHE